MMTKLKILISCYACSPYRGSEPGMGWKFVTSIANDHEVHVIVEQEKWEPEINRYFSENSTVNKNMNFYYIRKSRNRTLRKIWPPSYYWFYKNWQLKAFKLAEKLHNREEFDLIHQLNMVGYREPGYLWKIDLPFVWGPIGGLENTPWRFFSEFGFYGKLFHTGRNVLNNFQMNYLGRPKKAATRKNNCLIAATANNQKLIKKVWDRKSIIISEVGLEESGVNSINQRSSDERLKLVWSGLHIPRKALNLLLDSLSKLPTDVNWTLDILGAGEMTEKWKQKATQLKIYDKCNWHGWIPKKDSFNIMAQGHIFCITSLLDLTSSVTLEAISYGLPIICLDHHGFSNVVNNSCGIKIPVTNPKNVIHAFALAIEKLYYNELLRQEMAEGALKRAQKYTWAEKIDDLNTIYNKLINENFNNS